MCLGQAVHVRCETMDGSSGTAPEPGPAVKDRGSKDVQAGGQTMACPGVGKEATISHGVPGRYNGPVKQYVRTRTKRGAIRPKRPEKKVRFAEVLTNTQGTVDGAAVSDGDSDGADDGVTAGVSPTVVVGGGAPAQSKDNAPLEGVQGERSPGCMQDESSAQEDKGSSRSTPTGPSIREIGGSLNADPPSVVVTGFTVPLGRSESVKVEIGDNHPRTYGIGHEEPVASVVMKFVWNMMNCSERELDRKWYKHKRPTLVHLSGWDFKIEFSAGGKITFIGWCVVHRLLTYQEFKIYKMNQLQQHVMSVDARYIDYAYMSTMMSSEHLGYKLQYVKQLMMPLEFMDSWAVYMFDAENKHMVVMDPTMGFETADVIQAKHEENVRKMLYGLIRCIHENIPDWDITAGGWKTDFYTGAHFNCTREQSGIYILHYIREYNGVYVRGALNIELLEYLRSSTAYQLVSMKGNSGDLPDFMIRVVF